MAIQNGFIQIIQDEKRDYQYEEAMKTLRTNIQFSGNGLKVIMLTSAMPDEGKSETSFQLAISMAHWGSNPQESTIYVFKSIYSALFW